MITIEGRGDSHSNIIWMSWWPVAGMTLPTWIGAWISPNPKVSPVMPCGMHLPPTTASGLWFDTRYTSYGGRVSKQNIGYLIGSQSPTREPLPCEHSTLTGTAMSCGPLEANIPRLRYMVAVPEVSFKYYSSTGVRRSFCYGRATGPGAVGTYDERGNLGPITPQNTGNSILWNTMSRFYPVGLSGSPSITRPYSDAHIGEWIFTIPPTVEVEKPFSSFRHSWVHTSANVWEEVWEQCYHSNSSYVPKSPYAADGFGFTFADVKRTRKWTLGFVQQKTLRTFVGRFYIEETAEYSGHVPGGFHPEWREGTSSSTYSSDIVLIPLDPGLCWAHAYDWTIPQFYCQVAPARAKELYSEQDMIIARSRAIADVTGLDSNWIENLAQVGGTLEVIRPLLDGYQAVVNKDLETARHALASAYLVYKYSISPTIRDYHDVSDNFGKTVKNFTKFRFSNERRRGSNHSVATIYDGIQAKLAYYCTFHLVLKDGSFSTIWNALEQLGLDPSIDNLWDLVPYGFVADWFLKIGPALSRISAYTSSVLTRGVKSRIQSYKAQWDLPESDVKLLLPVDLQACGDLTYSWYNRRIDNRIGVIDVFAGQSIGEGLSVSQMTQGAALLSNYIR